MSSVISGTHLYAADIGALYDEKYYEAAYAASCTARREKTDRYVFKKDKCLSLGAEMLILHALENAGISDGYGYDKYGRPVLKGEKAYISVSHSSNMALVAISEYEVGCDIEKISDADMKIAKRFFAADEYEKLGLLPENERNEAFFKYWTAKESFVKCIGLGMKIPFDSFEIVCENSVSIKQSYSDEKYSIVQSNAISGYAISACIKGENKSFLLDTEDLKKVIQGWDKHEKFNC